MQIKYNGHIIKNVVKPQSIQHLSDLATGPSWRGLLETALYLAIARGRSRDTVAKILGLSGALD